MEINMNNRYIMGYKVNSNIKYFRPNRILFENEHSKISVSMINDALDYILSIISIHFPPADSYKKARKVFNAVKMILANKQIVPLKKEELKLAVDVLEEVVNLSAKSNEEKQNNAKCAGLCKMMIDKFSSDANI